MIAWPLTLPEPNLLTIPASAPLPASYWRAVAQGRWPHAYWLPTAEPTSDGLDGVAIHALATPGPRAVVAGLPAALLPLAVDGQQVFAVAPDGRIRYIDLEVAQWLDVAASWEAFAAQLQWRSPQLDDSASAQQLAHALLVADDAALPRLFERLRENGDWEAYSQWLQAFAGRAPAQEEAAFARQFLPLNAAQIARLP